MVLIAIADPEKCVQITHSRSQGVDSANAVGLGPPPLADGQAALVFAREPLPVIPAKPAIKDNASAAASPVNNGLRRQ